MTLEEYARQQQQHPEEQAEQLQTDRQRTRLELEQEKQQQEKQQAFEVYKKYQENIRKTESISTDILKGLQRGESLATLFLQAVRAYTLCTGNKAEYDIIADTLQTVYGKALHDAGAVELTADAIRNRLEHLQAAYSKATHSNEKSRLEQAINAHKRELASLLQNNG